VNRSESKYLENAAYLSRYTHERLLAQRESDELFEPNLHPDWLKLVQEELPRFLPFLQKECGVEFHGRILEIGSGAAWFSAELSKQPRVVELMVTDFSPRILKEHAPKVFTLLKAKTDKITRMPADFHRLAFPDNHFDFVVSSGALHHATNIVQVLREAKRVLKPGGSLVAIREPVWPLVKIKSRAKTLEKLLKTGVNERFYTLSDYQEFFRQASLPMVAHRVNTSTGFKYYVDKMVNGLTHARYAFVGAKKSETRRVKVQNRVPATRIRS
jgi:ubiquinone/menaquinone biosynthesis C-methylase UbiE